LPVEPLICVVDDDLSVRKALVALIESMGYRCAGYASAEAVLESGDVGTASCILTDIHMPGLDGFALRRMLVDRGHPACMIMMTARSEAHLERRALEAGALCFLRKPLLADALAACLARAVCVHSAERRYSG
jgi:FixJ family two-component response regulator